jgi:hypothetical protein
MTRVFWAILIALILLIGAGNLSIGCSDDTFDDGSPDPDSDSDSDSDTDSDTYSENWQCLVCG